MNYNGAMVLQRGKNAMIIRFQKILMKYSYQGQIILIKSCKNLFYPDIVTFIMELLSTVIYLIVISLMTFLVNSLYGMTYFRMLPKNKYIEFKTHQTTNWNPKCVHNNRKMHVILCIKLDPTKAIYSSEHSQLHVPTLNQMRMRVNLALSSYIFNKNDHCTMNQLFKDIQIHAHVVWKGLFGNRIFLHTILMHNAGNANGVVSFTNENDFADKVHKTYIGTSFSGHVS